MVYYGESGELNIYSRPDDSCQEFWQKVQFQKSKFHIGVLAAKTSLVVWSLFVIGNI